MNGYRKKHPLVSALLSFVFPGAGQLYNEEFIKGTILLSAAIASIVSIIYNGITMGNSVMNGEAPTTHIIRIVTSCLIYFCLWLYGIIDGAISAQRISDTTPSATEAEITKPKTKEGLITLGVVMVIIGLFSFLHQLGIHFGLLIKYGWPIALILIGAYLLAKNAGILKGGQ